MNKKLLTIWMTLVILLSTLVLFGQTKEQVHASGDNDPIQIETKIWDAQTQQWVDEANFEVGSTVRLKCIITNFGPYDFSFINITNTFPGFIDYVSSGVAPYYVSPDNKIIKIRVPPDAACLYSGGTWGFESLVGTVVSSDYGYNSMSIDAVTYDGTHFYGYNTVILHSTHVTDIIRVETKIWDAQTQQWVDEANFEVGSTVRLKCIITNFGPYDFSSIRIINTFPQIIDYLDSSVAPFNVYSDNKKVAIVVPSDAECLHSGGIWSFELFGTVVSWGSGDNKIEIMAEKDAGDQFYDFYTVTLHAMTIIIVPEEPVNPEGWIYGTVLNGTSPVEGVLVSISTKSAYTDSNGYYEIYNVSVGYGSLRATKGNYVKNIKELITINLNEGTKFDFDFSGGYFEEDVPDYMKIKTVLIEDAIEKGYVGSKISIWGEKANTFEHEISIYNGLKIKNLNIKKDYISCIVVGNETSDGKTIVINIDDSVFDLSSQILVNYDGESISMADDIYDILDPNDDGPNAEYLIVIGSNGAQLLVSIPHFSEHTIEFFVQQVAQYLIYAVIFAVIIVIIAAVVMFRKGKED